MNTTSRLSRYFGLAGALLSLALFLSAPALAGTVDHQKQMERLNTF
ncbi:MAG: hypothetical protein KFF50_11740 [Desulfatitalea sp.]|nr:hypothetical protein [Desulfatitalea sp.]